MLALAALRSAARTAEPRPAEPMMSFIVPVDKATPAQLDALVASFGAQDTGLAELILCGMGAAPPERKTGSKRNVRNKASSY